MKKYLSLLFSLLLTSLLMGQGTVRGTVIDDNGEPALYANVLVKELSTGTATDLDGKYNLSLEPGKYTLQVSYLGYSTKTITDVVVEKGKVKILDVTLVSDAEELVEVVVTSGQVRNTAAALNTLKRKSPVLMDGITNQTFKRTGDSDASGAIARVTGVSVQGGKYVFVRGIGDRYTKTILNNMDVPGLDPDRNSIQIDIFPTNLIDNIIVLKTFSPDLPGDFTGGVINIETKEFPEEKSLNVSVGVGYNPDMNLNSNFLTYEGGATDMLGFDDGTRNLPGLVANYNSLGKAIPNPASNNAELTNITNSFSKNLAAQEGTSPLNYNFSLSGGNQYNFDSSTLGVNFALNYRNTTTYFDDAEFNQYLKAAPLDVNELETNKDQFGRIGTNNVFLSGLIGTAFKTKNSKISLTALHLQNGQSTAGAFVQNTYINTDARLIRDNLEYNQRSLTNALLNGEHTFKGDKFKLEWKVAPTYSLLKDKDIRLTSFRQEGSALAVEFSEGAVPTRIFRDLEEMNLSSRVDFTTKLFSDKTGRSSKIKVGASYAFKQRDYGILNYQFNILNQDNVNVNGDPDLLLDPNNVWTPERRAGTYAIGNFEPANTFNAEQRVLGVYAMNDIELSDKFRAVYGVRAENFQHIYTGQNQQGGIVFNNETLIDNWSILPSVNLIYSIVENMNIRASYSKTVARPSFKEASIAQIYDALSDRTYIGNINLVETDINNFDFRWELFQDKGQSFSVSAFYKTFVNPIELVAFKPQTPNDFQPKNVGDAQILGLEMEFRKSLSFISPVLSNFEIGSNVTLVQSEVEMDEEEYNSRLAVARNGETVERTRQMQGQSPYIVNAFFNYLGGVENGWEANVSYNVQGPSLFIVGIGANPDVFQQPFHSLNFKVTKGFGVDNRYRLGLRVTNLLNDDQLKLYESYLATSQRFERFVPGRTISLSFSYRIF